MKAYINENGVLNIEPEGPTEEYALGIWNSRVRAEQYRGPLFGNRPFAFYRATGIKIHLNKKDKA